VEGDKRESIMHVNSSQTMNLCGLEVGAWMCVCFVVVAVVMAAGAAVIEWATSFTFIIGSVVGGLGNRLGSLFFP